jgi:hypothetical protein
MSKTYISVALRKQVYDRVEERQILIQAGIIK